MGKHGKKHLEALKLVETGRAYDVPEATKLAKQASHAKFDETVELH
ncbi:MAG: 50S ribosomal protein L1, partial [Chloroflexi bacterium]|nr:50S ribosomal protein L1 [Chloroflexota bacterium]